ncbi:MAG: hypothetical protein AAGD04_16735 [Pseudomonadota bacterium]
MDQSNASPKAAWQPSFLGSLGIIALGLLALFALGHFDPVPEQAQNQDSVFLYYGEAAETRFMPDLSEDIRRQAEDALRDAPYFASFAKGKSGRTGHWIGARSQKLADVYSRAACGADCEIIARRAPVGWIQNRPERVLTPEMAKYLGQELPFSREYLALGGAGAWGHRTKGSGRFARNSALRRAGAECEARRTAEGTPNSVVSAPCTVTKITEIIDLRPEPPLYPAAFHIDLTDLRPVQETDLSRIKGAPFSILAAYKPPSLHGARASNGKSATGHIRRSGWPEAGDKTALARCDAERRFGEPHCAITHRRVPSPSPPEGSLAVTQEIYEGYLDWQKTTGAGAFAISPYGPWGYSSGHASREAAIQKAADWCWFHTRKSWSYRRVDESFVDPGITCRIVALRDP